MKCQMKKAASQTAAQLLLPLLLIAEWGSCRGPCDPLVPEYCGLPFPNSFYTMASSLTPTGLQVNFSSQTFPKDLLGRGVDPAEWNTLDGFSVFPSILSYFSDLSDSLLPPHWDMQQSLAADCPTILLDAHTGERFPHFAELDTAANLSRPRALMMWPAQSLHDNSRYIVALRYLRNNQGELVKPSQGFLALRDNISTSDPDIESRRALFEDIFSRLEAAGVQRKSLQLAWDFPTASLECLTKRLLFVREDAFARVGAKGPHYKIDQVDDNYSEHVYRRLIGTMSIPVYLNNVFPGSHLVINGNGYPTYQNNAEATFTILIPHSLANGSIYPGRILQYGHGLFGSQTEVEQDYLQYQADKYGYVLGACDWWGMTWEDVPALVDMLAMDIGNFRVLPDRLTQGMTNALLLMRLMKGGLASDPNLVFGGRTVIDPQLANYYGNSLGGIMGDVYMAATTDVTRGVLGVAGGPFGMLLPRSKDFQAFEIGVRILYPDPVDFTIALALGNMIWSRLEPNAYMAHITSNPLPGTPTHRVLMHYALGDAQVNILGFYSIARSANAVMYESNVREQFTIPNGKVVTEKLFGFQMLPDNTTVTQDAVALGFECGAPPEPAGNIPPDSKYDTHEVPRHSKLAMEQIDQFLRTGEIKNVCAGPCKC